MTDIINYSINTKILDIRTEQLHKTLYSFYSSDIVSNEEMEYMTKIGLYKILNNLGKSHFEVKEARVLPLIKDYEDMIQTTSSDLNVIIYDNENLNEVEQNIYNKNKITTNMITGKVNYLQKKLGNLKEAIYSNNIQDKLVVITDDFSNDTSTQNASYDTKKAYIDTNTGILTLNIDKRDKSTFEDVEVLNGSNGLPGNTHVAGIKNGNVIFDGEQNLHVDLNEIVDGKDTWFEYEIFKIDENIKDSCYDLGFEYKEGVQWITEDNILRLKLRLILKEEKFNNIITLSPYLPNTKGSKPPVIDKVTISSQDKSEVQIISNAQLFDDNVVILFERQRVKFVEIELSQDTAYETKVGHVYFKDEDKIRYEEENPSVSVLNIKYNPITKKTEQPKTYIDSRYKYHYDNDLIKDELFNIKKPNGYKELLEAKRLCIGLRNISIASHRYFSNSVYVSKTFTTEKAIQTITLDAKEYIPNELLTSADNPIKYFITFDDGKEWLPMTPKHRCYSGVSQYIINSNTVTQLNNKGVRYINKLIEPTTVRVKIELSRPSDESYVTPVLYSYSLYIKTGDEKVD